MKKSPNNNNNKHSRTSRKKTKGLSLREFFRLSLSDETGRRRDPRDVIPFVLGLCIVIFSIYLLMACISYVDTAAADQSMLEQVAAGQNVSNLQAKNITGRGGAWLAHKLIDKGFGLTAVLVPVFGLLLGLRLMKVVERARLWSKFLHLGFLMIWGSAALALAVPRSIVENLAFSPAGEHGNYICNALSTQIGTPGLLCVLIALILIYLVYLTQKTITLIRGGLRKVGQVPGLLAKIRLLLKKTPQNSPQPQEPEPPSPHSEQENPVATIQQDGSLITFNEQPAKKTRGSHKTAHKDDEFHVTKPEDELKAAGKTLANYDPRLDLEFYKFPTLDLLQKYKIDTPIDMAEQQANKERIKSVLHSFGVEISRVEATVGPTVTLYEITLAEGIRVSKVRGLADDIALSLSALGIRIIAPIPGKGTIGIEVPNKNPQLVPIESVLNSKKFSETRYELPLALGKTITNEVFMVDLAKLPHLLVAGATGQGKSVGLNTIISSLLYKKHPSELKLVLIDPKKVEFSIYAPLEDHFLAKYPEDSDAIVTDVTKVVRVLRSLCQEMEDRYDLLGKANCRNIKEYNRLFVSRQLNPQNGHRFLPYFVIIIDEYGDLIMTAGKDIELPIARIAQKARAVGMHMVIATQRPTANIITGTIKANFPARMAFRVASQVDSRTILDQSGANQLVGKGDMLILASEMLPSRVQCAFIDTQEVINVTQFISEQQGYGRAYELPLVAEGDSPIISGGNMSDGTDDGLDPMLEEAARFVISKRSGSTSSLQRRFSIGYNRAGRLMDQLEKVGVVGPAQGSKPRDILMTESELNAKLSLMRPGYNPPTSNPLDLFNNTDYNDE